MHLHAQAAQLPPGEPLVSLSPGLMHRSELAGPRHAMRVAGRGLSPPTRPRVPSPETALRARAQAHDVVVVGGAHRYARRPYTARAYVESVMAVGAWGTVGMHLQWAHGGHWVFLTSLVPGVSVCMNGFWFRLRL